MINNNYLNSILKHNTKGPMKVISLISLSGNITIFAVRKTEKQMNFLHDYLLHFGLRTYFV